MLILLAAVSFKSWPHGSFLRNQTLKGRQILKVILSGLLCGKVLYQRLLPMIAIKNRG